jgi:hypothetical protein
MTGRKTAFVFTGGGRPTSAMTGAGLLASGLFPDFVVAPGRRNQCRLFRLRPDLNGVEALERIWGDRRADIFPFSPASLSASSNIREHCRPGGLRRVIEANLLCARIEETKILHIMATNHHGQAVRPQGGPRSRRSWRVPQYRACFRGNWRRLLDGWRSRANTPVRLAAELARRGSSSRQPATPALARAPRTVIGARRCMRRSH